MAERALRNEDGCIGFSSEICIIDKVLGWLEKEDGDVENIVGYGVCVAALTYFIARLFQMLF